MQNDPFAFIGSNAYNDQSYSNEQAMENYNPTQNMNYESYRNSHQSDNTNLSDNLSDYYRQEQASQDNARQRLYFSKKGGFATFGPGGILVSSFPFVANRFEIVNGKSLPRTLNLSRVKLERVENLVYTKFIDLFKGPLVSTYTRKKSDVLDLMKEIRERKSSQDFDYLLKLLVLLVENDGVLLNDKNDANTFKKILSILDYVPVVNSSSSAFETIQALLAQGNALGACDYAQATNLWAHALIIGAFIDQETYSSTLNAFIEYEFSPGEKNSAFQVSQGEELVSLQVIYNLFSNGSNESLLQILQSRNWDWRLVLSTVLANPTSNILTAICSIGDELGKLDLMDAAHFCYLLCFTHAGVEELDLSRVFLVSSDHINHSAFYRDSRAIQMTELLEYAKSLAGSTLPHFQVYKFAYALELADFGKSDLSAEYLLAIQSILSEYKGTFGDKFALLSDAVDEVSDRLSVHFSKCAYNSKKHAGWFAKGLDSLVSAAVGETLDTLDVKKKSRKYSMSNLSMADSDSLSASLSRTESAQNQNLCNVQQANDANTDLGRLQGNEPYLNGNNSDLKSQSYIYNGHSGNNTQFSATSYGHASLSSGPSTIYSNQSADRKYSPGTQLTHPNRGQPNASMKNGLGSISNSGYTDPSALNYQKYQNPQLNSGYMNPSSATPNYEKYPNQNSYSNSGYMNPSAASPNYEKSSNPNSYSTSGYVNPSSTSPNAGFYEESPNSNSYSGYMNPSSISPNYGNDGKSLNHNPPLNSGYMNPSSTFPNAGNYGNDGKSLNHNPPLNSGYMNPSTSSPNYEKSPNPNLSTKSGYMNPSPMVKNYKISLNANSSNPNSQPTRNQMNGVPASATYNPSEIEPQYHQSNFNGLDQNTSRPETTLKSDSLYLNGDSSYKSDPLPQAPYNSAAMNANTKSSSSLETPTLDNNLELKQKPVPSQVEVKDSAPPSSKSNAPASKGLVDSIWGSFSLFGKSSKHNSNSESNGPIKAKLGGELSCYFDDVTGKWVFPDAPQTEEVAPLPPPPQTKAPPPSQNNSAATSRQPSPAPSGATSPAPLSSTPKPTYIGALGGSSRATRRTARSKYVDLLNPNAQTTDVQPSFNFTPVNNFGTTEPKIMKPVFTPTTSYSTEQNSESQDFNSHAESSRSQSGLSASPKIPRVRPHPTSGKPGIVNGVPSGVRSPATRPSAGVARPPRPVGHARPAGPTRNNGVPTNMNGYTRPVKPQNTQSNSNTAAMYNSVKRRPLTTNARPITGRPIRPLNGSSRAPDDL